jgi:GTP-binding protein
VLPPEGGSYREAKGARIGRGQHNTPVASAFRRKNTLKLLSAEFVTSAAAGGRIEDIPHDGLAQFALAGRSNVGKSSLLNALCRRSIARTSAAPGKTRLANIFRVTAEGGPGGPGKWTVYFVDLPGYGYARGGSDSAAELAAVAEAYFASRDPRLAARERTADLGERPAGAEQSRGAVFQLIDSRHPGLESDVEAGKWFDSFGVVRHVVATKVDKLSRAERARNLRELDRVFGRAALPVSVTSGEGLDELWRLIARLARGAE